MAAGCRSRGPATGSASGWVSRTARVTRRRLLRAVLATQAERRGSSARSVCWRSGVGQMEVGVLDNAQDAATRLAHRRDPDVLADVAHAVAVGLGPGRDQTC